MQKRIKRPISGVLLLDKPTGFSSNGALQKVRWLYQAEKAGHTGNLDPLATGLLPVCLGEATKFSQFLLNADKAYRASIRLGVTTDSGDSDGNVLQSSPVEASLEQVRSVLAGLVGEVEQIPPMYSALKHQGRALYEYARQGVDVVRQPRRITLFSIELLAFQADSLDIAVACSKGTYIRVLAEEIGRQLGCGAHLTGLRRTRTAGFDLADAITLDQLEAMTLAQRDARLLATDCLLGEMIDVQLSDQASHSWCHGNPVWQAQLPAAGELRVYDAAHRFIGLGQILPDGRLAPKRVVRPPPPLVAE